MFIGLRVTVVFIEPAPVDSFNRPIGGTARHVAHDEHPSAEVVHPFTEAVVGFDAVPEPNDRSGRSTLLATLSERDTSNRSEFEFLTDE